MQIIFGILFTVAAHAAELPGLKTECFTHEQPLPWAFCVNTAEGSTNPDLVYHFHGLGGDERGWNDDYSYTGQVHKEWLAEGRQPPTVVGVSFGPLWLLIEKNSRPESGLFELMAGVVLPEIEAKLKPRGRRLLVGESMGGLNALAFYLKAGGLFKKVAALCPPMPTFSPYAPAAEIDAYIERTRALPEKVRNMVKIARAFAADDEEWKRISPLELIGSLDVAKAPQLYLSCGRQDEYGVFEGAEQLAAKAQGRGARLEWRPVFGKHCSVDVRSLARFLIE